MDTWLKPSRTSVVANCNQGERHCFCGAACLDGGALERSAAQNAQVLGLLVATRHEPQQLLADPLVQAEPHCTA